MRAKAWNGYTEEATNFGSGGIPRTVKFTEFFKEGDWAVKTYPNNHIINMTHKHKNGTTYVIPFRYCVTKRTNHDTYEADYGCHVCHEKAPESVVVVWKFLNWDIAVWE